MVVAEKRKQALVQDELVVTEIDDDHDWKVGENPCREVPIESNHVLQMAH